MTIKDVLTLCTYLCFLLAGLVLQLLGLITNAREDAWFNLFAAPVCLLLLWLIQRSQHSGQTRDEAQATVKKSLLWVLFGFLMVIAAQMTGMLLTKWLFHPEAFHDPTDELIRALPAVALIGCFVAPMSEEIIFRKLLFGALQRRYGFWLGSILSAAIFAAAHLNLNGFLQLFLVGWVLAFVYWKTKRLLTSILVHVTMNLLVLTAML